MDENITYCLNEQNNSNDVALNSNSDLTKLLNEFEELKVEQYSEYQHFSDYENYSDFQDFSNYQNNNVIDNMTIYDLKYTIKQLLLICEYYGLLKQSKKMKKLEIISLIIEFENDMKNIGMTIKRKELWSYMDQLKNDKIMKKFVIW